MNRVLILLIAVFASVLPGGAAVPAAPQNVRTAWIVGHEDIEADHVLLTWDASAEPVTYNVRRYNPARTAWEIIATGLAEPRLRDYAATARPATYLVTAIGAGGESMWAAAIQYDVFPQFQIIVDPLDGANAPGATNAVIRWTVNNSSGAEGIVEVGTAAGSYEAFFAHNRDYTNQHRVAVSNLAPGRLYYFRLTAVGTNRAGFTYHGTFVTPEDQNATANRPPTAYPQWITVNPDTATPTTLTAADPEGGTMVFQVTGGPAHGRLSGVAPNLTYSPNAGFQGSDSFTFVASDGTAASAPATVSIMVLAMNDAPFAVALAITTTENTALPITLMGANPGDESASFEFMGGLAHGVLAGTPPDLTYTGLPGFRGTENILFRARDAALTSYYVTLSVTVGAAQNSPPVALGQSLSVAQGQPLPIVLSGSSPAGGELTCVVVNGPAHGTLTGQAPNLTYLPHAQFTGPDSFTFIVNDGTSDSAPATVSISVLPVNRPPVAGSLTVTTPQGTPIGLTLTAADADGDPLTFTLSAPALRGTLAGTAPNLVFTPEAGFSGTTAFQFHVSDGQAIATGSVTINVAPANQPPAAFDQSVLATEDRQLLITLAGSDPEGALLQFTIVNPPARGVLSGTGAVRTYTPATNYNGSDSFTFKVNDGMFDSAVATVRIHVTAANDAPTSFPLWTSTAFNTPARLTLTGSDPDGDALTYLIVSPPANGTLSGSGASLVFTPNTGWSGITTFTFRVNDGALNSLLATGTVSVAKSGYPAAPIGLTATTASKSIINLTWTDNSSNESGFKVERSTDGSSWSRIATVGSNVRSYSSTGLSSNKKYYYRVRAYNSKGSSYYSNVASATTLR